MKQKRRKYVLKARAESQDETRERIVVAAMELHERLGPARTSITAIAERAGVQRLTVYRHFPDEIALLRACGGHYRALHPPPDLATLRAIDDPRDRLGEGLVRLYRHFRATQAMWANVLRDVEVSEVVREAAEPRFRYVEEAAQVLGTGWPHRLARAVIGHAVEFRTWQSLARQDLDDEDAAELMTRFAVAVSLTSPSRGTP
jgi:AcrR family transcriptional regulator